MELRGEVEKKVRKWWRKVLIEWRGSDRWRKVDGTIWKEERMVCRRGKDVRGGFERSEGFARLDIKAVRELQRLKRKGDEGESWRVEG